MSRVYIPGARKFGTVTGSHSYGLTGPVYLRIVVDGGETVRVLEAATIPADRAPIPDPRNSGNVVSLGSRARPTTTVITGRFPDGDGPSAA